jgi:hypothetical protein
VVYVFLAALTVWPAVQIWLTQAYGVSPWKLGGWGMYAVPRPKYVGMTVLYRARGTSELVPLQSPDEADRAAANAFLERYRWLGTLAFPQDFASSMLARHPDWEAMKIVLSQPVLDRRSAMVVMREEVYEAPPASELSQ